MVCVCLPLSRGDVVMSLNGEREIHLAPLLLLLLCAPAPQASQVGGGLGHAGAALSLGLRRNLPAW